MHNIDTVLHNSTEQGHVPGVVAAAATPQGIFYEGAFGKRNLDTQTPMTPDTVFRIFSMTKAVCSVAAAILYERGQLHYDELVENIIPAFGEKQVLEGFEGDEPILRTPKTKATVRNLATHTSGLAYDIWNPLIKKYLKVTQTPNILTGQKHALTLPLVCDPGAKWEYGIGIDWLGQVIEAVSGQTLADFCQEELFKPLGMNETSFHCEGTQRERLVTLHTRNEDGSLSVADEVLPAQPEFYPGGHGLYSTARDYMQFLLMLLNNGTYHGTKIFKPETIKYVQNNHIGDLMVENMHSVLPTVSNTVELPTAKHSLGFVTNLQQEEGMRSAHSQTWAGLLNTYFWYDPTRGLAGIILMQILPFYDHNAIALYRNFEKAVYKSL